MVTRRRRKLYTVPARPKTGARVGGGSFKPRPTKSWTPKKGTMGINAGYTGSLKYYGMKNKVKFRVADKRHPEHLDDVKYLHQRRPVRTAGKTLETVATPSTPLIFNGYKPATTEGGNPAVTEHSKKPVTLGNSSTKHHQHSTKFTTGNNIPKILKMVKKQNGALKRWLFDTTNQSGTDLVTRNTLELRCGFNDKSLWILPAYAFVHSEDVQVQLDILLADRPSSNRLEKALAALEYVQTQIKLYNQSAYMGVKVKIYVFTNRDTGNYNPTTPVARLTQTLNQAAETSVPQRFIQEGVSAKDVTNFREWSLKASMNPAVSWPIHSPYMRNNVTVVKTFSKTLEPGDQWVFDHKHFCGSGIDIFALIDQINPTITAAYDPIGYMYAIEVMGVPCEGVMFGNFDGTGPAEPVTHHLGSSPGYVQCDFRKGLQYIQRAQNSSDSIDGGGLNPSSRAHLRTQSWDPNTASTTSKENFVTAGNIIESGIDTAIAGQMYIPVISDREVRIHGPKSPFGND